MLFLGCDRRVAVDLFRSARAPPCSLPRGAPPRGRSVRGETRSSAGFGSCGAYLLPSARGSMSARPRVNRGPRYHTAAS
eukprot:3504227-Prymnesium_polylepis.1